MLQYYRGRGAFESMGAGIEMEAGDIAFKCNFATIDDASGIVLFRRCDRDFTKEGPVLCAALGERAGASRLDLSWVIQNVSRRCKEGRCPSVSTDAVRVCLTPCKTVCRRVDFAIFPGAQGRR